MQAAVAAEMARTVVALAAPEVLVEEALAVAMVTIPLEQVLPAL
jgi:hypothetical protein